MNDIGKPTEIIEHGQGFAEASCLLASDVDSESFLFRKFNRLSARNILYLQCEVLALEEKLEKLDRLVDRSTDTSLQESARKWEMLVIQCNEAIAGARWKVKTLLGRRDRFGFLESASRGRFSFEKLRAYWPGQDELSRDGVHRIRRYNEKSITVAIGLISIALAAALLIRAIVGFSYVCLTTNAKWAEIFAGRAA
ncbi:hypothetical protein CSAL01_07178 [Colletotrichum salicis]|uniref:DUF6594 domain-containing protein n=1 Tax=Colletotrichum salicis TaxID=1209931 RepID=A0A135U5Q2_9PEZI|nr:hypothetical protein CSAL01_07178 [Colletotrichum salicis]